MERSDWLYENWGGVNKTIPRKSVKGFVWADKRRCDWSDKNDIIDPGIYNGVKRFFLRKDGDRQVSHADQRDA